MADPVEFEIRADTREAVNDLKKLEQQLEDVGDEAEGAGGATEGFSTKLTAATVAGAALVAGLREAVATIKEMAAEYERTAAIINRFSGDISNASERVSGLISNLDLMIESNKLAAAGFELTAEEFGALSVAAAEFAAKSGEDAAAVMQQLTQAVITGGEELIKFDVNISEAKDATDKQIAAITQLTERYDGMSASADSLAGQVATLEVQIENMTSDLIEQVNQSAALDRELDKLFGTLGMLGGQFFDTEQDVIRFGDVVTGVLINVTRRIAALAEAINQLGSQDFEGAGRALARGFGPSVLDDIGTAAGERTAREHMENLRRKQEADQAGGIGSRVPGNVARAGGGGDSEGSDPFADLGEEEFLDQLLADADAYHEERLKMEAQFQEDKLEAQRTAAEEEKRIAEEINQKHADLAKQRAQFEQDKLDAIQSARDQDIQNIQKGVGIANAAGTMLMEQFGATRGQMELWQGSIDAIMAITKFALREYDSGALLLISSAGHFANAASMGVGGGGGSPAAGAASAGAGGGSARPVASGSGGGGGGPVNYTVNINSPVTERDVGRMQRRAEQERSRRFDARV